MAESFPFELVSPERLVLSQDVTEVRIPASDGQMTIMKNHAPTMTTVKPGVVFVKLADGSDETIFVDGGFADINANGLSLLAEVAMPSGEMDGDTLSKHISGAEEAAASSDGALQDIAALRLADLVQAKSDLSL